MLQWSLVLVVVFGKDFSQILVRITVITRNTVYMVLCIQSWHVLLWLTLYKLQVRFSHHCEMLLLTGQGTKAG